MLFSIYILPRFSEHVREHELHHSPSSVAEHQQRRVLPILALNDVFIGESLSARSVYIVRITFYDPLHWHMIGKLVLLLFRGYRFVRTMWILYLSSMAAKLSVDIYLSFLYCNFWRILNELYIMAWFLWVYFYEPCFTHNMHDIVLYNCCFHY